MYKLILFDFYGVFCPDLATEWFKQMMPDYRKHLAAFNALCDLSNKGELSREGFREELSRLTGVPVGEISAGINKRMSANQSLVQFAWQLKRRYKLGLLSNAQKGRIEQIVVDYGMEDLFDELIISAEIGVVKPHKGIFEYALNKFAVAPAEAVFIDDRQSNVDAASRYGIASVLFIDTTTLAVQLEALGVK